MKLPKSIKKLTDNIWEIPESYKAGMNVPVRIYASEKLITEMDEGVFGQISNVAALPGITGPAYCMPDGHWGYGFPIGGVAAFDPETGVISPGGIGFDINCGMRLIRTILTVDEVRSRIRDLVDKLFKRIPAGVGTTGFVVISRDEFREVVESGAQWCVKNGYGVEEDIDLTEEKGCVAGADASKVSASAIERGYRQIGTLGSGNHYLEIQVAKPVNIYDPKLAKTFGIDIPNQVCIMLHCGSRGFGHQVATDYLHTFLSVMGKKYDITTPDRELACAPFRSQEGQDYFAAMKCAINMSYVNRQVILHRVREVFSDVFHRDPADLGLHMIYDIAHNTAMLEKHIIDGTEREVLVHRKGATRAFGPGSTSLPAVYRNSGQPVIIGGSMETGSYLLAGLGSGEQTLFTTAHGSGRTMSRRQAKKLHNGKQLQHDLEERGIYIRTASYSALAEEVGEAYKNIDDVVAVTENTGISKRVVRFVPIGNIKG
ncbi:MAG: RtcB family protein [Candidatus Latescibacteria bacterium]|nr:RtcB family protein [Candidatus Latescibacterota bacterium]